MRRAAVAPEAGSAEGLHRGRVEALQEPSEGHDVAAVDLRGPSGERPQQIGEPETAAVAGTARRVEVRTWRK